MAGRLGVALVGPGEMGRFHARTLAERLPEARLAAVAGGAGPSAHRLAEELGVAAWSADPAEVIGRADVDAVVIASPDTTHAGLIRLAAAAGKHVFCEKPLALDLAETDAALAAVRAAGVKLQLGFQRRFDEGFRSAKRLIGEGGIGPARFVHSRTRDPVLNLDPASLEASSRIFHSTGVHDFDVVRFLSGAEVEEVYALGAALVAPVVADAGQIDHAVLSLTLSTGALASIDLSWQAVYGYDVSAEVLGSEGAVRVGAGQATPLVHLAREGERRDHPSGYLQRFGAAYEAELRAFVRCVLDDGAPEVTGEDGRAATAIALAATRSLATGAPVRVREVEAESGWTGWTHR